MGHGAAHHGQGFRHFGIEIQWLEHGVDQIGVSVDEPQSEGVVQQDFVEHVAVHSGIIRVPCPIDEVVVDAGSEEAKPCIRIVHQIPPRLIWRCAESFDVIEAPSQPQPVGVLGVRFKDKVIDVIFDVKMRFKGGEETRTVRRCGQECRRSFEKVLVGSSEYSGR